MRLARTILFTVAVLAIVPAGVTAAATDSYRSSPNLELVAQIIESGGTDLEFFSRTLATYKDRDGAMLAPPEPVERHFALVGNQSQGPRIVDITDPEQPYIAATVPACRIGQGDPQVNAAGTLAAIAKQNSGSCTKATGGTLTNGSAMVDLSEVYSPKVIGFAVVAAGSHNHTLHPGGKYLYVSPSLGAAGPNSVITIFNVTDPVRPRLVQNWTTPGNGPHDIRFSNDGTRAYVAGISTYYILNTDNPEQPTLISTITPPGGYIGHDSLVTPDKAFLFLGDEAGGGAPYPCPGGPIFVYDIRNEASPTYLGMAEAGVGPGLARQMDEVPGPVRVGGCTAHVMALNPDNRSLTIGWYAAGTRTFDFNGLYDAAGNPKPTTTLAWGKNGVGMFESGWIVPDGANTWSAKQYAKVPGYIFSDDNSLGLYVTKVKAKTY